MESIRATWIRAVLKAIVVSAAASSASFAQTAGDPSGSFYLRAGVGLDRSRDATFTDRDCSSETPAALFGCGAGPDGAPFNSSGDFGTMVGFEVGAGYVATHFLRLEATVSHRPSITFEGRANFLESTRRQDVSADLSTLSVMFTAYLDLAQLGVASLGPLSPFVGAGAGSSRIDIDETRMEFPRTRTIVPGDSRTNLAWMLTAGVAAPLASNVILDVSWRYTDFGTVETGRGAGRVVWRDGSRDPLPLDLAETRSDLRSHGIWASVRYLF